MSSTCCLGPVDRSWVLRRPAAGVLGYATASGAAAGGVVGGLVDQRVGRATLPWVASGALFGAAVVSLAVGAAMVTCSRRFLRRPLLAAGWAVAAWSTAAALGRVPTAPLTPLGRVALWPLGSFDRWSLLPLAAAVVLPAVGLSQIGGLSVEQAQRRTALVGQLRFAATQRDLRTVVLLRRQLASERPPRAAVAPRAAAVGGPTGSGTGP